MKLLHYFAFIAVAALLVSCGDKEGPKVDQPSKKPAAIGTATNQTIKTAVVTPAPPPPVQPSTQQVQLFPSSAVTNVPPSTATEPARVVKPVAAAPTAVNEVKSSTRAPGKPLAKVVMVKTDEKFVILEFTSNEFPAPGSQLTLYRGKDRIATVKVTEPMRPPFITADILDGKPGRGDEVR